jgi:16S rRNA U516 pseudouridylate synthase RsuA-like enzyme
MPSRARRLRAEKAADFRKQAGDFDPSKAGRSLDLRRTKEQKRSSRPDRKPLKPAHNTTPGEGPRAPDGFPLVRLQRLMADAGVAARRVCESMIEQGKVEVNRKVVTRLPIFVDPRHDKITVAGRLLAVSRDSRHKLGSAGPTRSVYVMLNKPPRVMTTTSDDGGRTTVMELLDVPGRPRLFPVGRLDFNASGIVILTNDGDLANRLTHARYNVPRTYQLTLKGYASNEQLMELARTILPRSVAIDPRWFGATIVEQPVFAEPEEPNEQDADPRFRYRLLRKRREERERQARLQGPVPGAEDTSDYDHVDDEEAVSQQLNSPAPRQIGIEKVIVPTGEFVHNGPFRILRRGTPSSRNRAEQSRAGGPKTQIEFDLDRAPFASLDDLVTSTGLELQHWSLVAIGGVKLSGVTPGQWRMLTPHEVRTLKHAGTEPYKPSSGMTGPGKKLAGKTPTPGAGWQSDALPPARGGRPAPVSQDAEFARDDDAAFDAEYDGADFEHEQDGDEAITGPSTASGSGAAAAFIPPAAAGSTGWPGDTDGDEDLDELDDLEDSEGADSESDPESTDESPASGYGRPMLTPEPGTPARAKPAQTAASGKSGKRNPASSAAKPRQDDDASVPPAAGLPKNRAKGPRTLRPNF